jgi:Gpi18-like mannosyltransferase
MLPRGIPQSVRSHVPAEEENMIQTLFRNKRLLVFWVGGIVLGVALRFCLFNFESHDFTASLSGWYGEIAKEGWKSMAGDFSNYSPVYIYILYLVHRILPGLSSLYGIKLPGLFFDVAISMVSSAIVYRVTSSPWKAVGCGLAVLFAPTIFINSAYWGQSDAYYAFFILAGILACLVAKPTWGVLAFGCALAIKGQAVFAVPFFVGAILTRKIPLRALIWLPVPYLLSLIPALLAGRSIQELSWIYFGQAGYYDNMTLNAPNLYAWMYFYPYGIFALAGVLMTGGAVLLYWGGIVFRRQREISPVAFLLMASLSVAIVPFLLPGMHERYFYLVDLCTILLAFCCPRLFWLAIISQLSSLISYAPHLSLSLPEAARSLELIPLQYYAFGNLIIIIVLWKEFLQSLFPRQSALFLRKGPVIRSTAPWASHRRM